MDDRILFVPVSWAPDPAVFEKWPAVAALLSRLRSFLPVDILLWPALKGQKVLGEAGEGPLNAMRAQIRPEHHVLAVSSSETLLAALAERRVRSLVVCGFFPSPNAMAARGDSTLASAMLGMLPILANPHQFMRLVMTGADDEVVEKAAEEVQQTFDRAVWEKGQVALDFQVTGPLPLPTLYLRLPVLTPGRDEAFEYFRSFVPDARYDELREFGFHLHEADGGHELANKAIPFIQEVIAGRA